MSICTLENVGPVRSLSLEVPEHGGLVVLKGRNGSGKSRSLEALESVLTGKGALEVRDGALNGKVDAFGVTITVGRSTRRKGELEVESLSSKLNLSELIDPGLKTPDAADARRIKALCSVAGATPDPKLFHGLIGEEEFAKVVGTAATAADDIVLMAERIKRDLEAEARREEDGAEKAEGVALGAKNAISGIDVNGPSDSAALQAALEAAIKREAELTASAEHAARQQASASKARASLDAAEREYTGLSAAEAAAAQVATGATVHAAEQAVHAATQALLAARAEYESARNAHAAAISASKQADHHEAMVRQWREELSVQHMQGPSDDTLIAARQAVREARQAVEQGALIRQAKEQSAAMDAAMYRSVRHRTRASILREAAKGTDEVLSGVVGRLGTKLRVEAGRLVLDTHRGATYFDDLSAGERAKLAIDIGIDAVGAGGVLTISQEIFEGLDSANRRMIAEHAELRGVLILTAECSDDAEITAEVYG